MAFPSYTYTLTNGSTADAGQVNQNFSDILNGVSDTTKSISVSAITAAGTTTLNGPVSLGLSTSNDISVNGSLASSIAVKTNTSFDFGSATLGLKSVYIGGTSTFTTRVMSAATASWTLTLPTTAGTGGLFLKTDGAGVTSWDNISEPLLIQNLGLTASVSGSILTVALKTPAGVDPSSTTPVYAAFRNATATTGQYDVVSRASALSVAVPNGAFLGLTTAINQYIWVYLINDAGTIDIGVSGGNPFDDGTLNACTQVSAGATSAGVLYSTSTHSGSMPTRLVGRILVNEASTAWPSNPTELVLMPVPKLNRTAPVAVTLTYGGFGTVGGQLSYSWRDGKHLECHFAVTIGTVAGSVAQVSLGFNGVSSPSGMVIDSTAQVGANVPVGSYANSNANGCGYTMSANGTTTSVGFSFSFGLGSPGNGSANGSQIAATGGVVTGWYRVPIAGWFEFGA